MGDVGEFWRDVKDVLKEEKEKKSKDNYALISILNRYPEVIEYQIKNDGYHYIVTHTKDSKKTVIDVWPSTGRWSVRQGNKKHPRTKKGRGVAHMLKFLGIPLSNSGSFISSLE